GEALVVAYTQALKHALAELIANALDFTPERQSVEINHGQRDGQVWIQILDHGRGIAPQDQGKLFQRFVQIGRETQEQQGMGLGLFVAQQIIAAHGGSLELNSVPNGGTMVTIKLPLAGHE
ncbi:MAG: ATP-binding protein, partial [Anaerolineae bacterium]|nr:ATP-binding protein [Anaerolineae bacterium]